ncbi:MAG TPA: amidohydrolase family protein [Armatimonadota bacterium]|jgi:N-acetylglucosamine-6-phosphate deacetylase
MDKSLTIRNGNTLLPDGTISRCDVRIENGIIREIEQTLTAGTEFDASGAYVLPGLIDLHTHGIGYESTSLSSLADLAELEAARGATTFYPTFFASPEEIAEQMRRHRSETDELRQVPQVSGFRLESPYLHHAGGGLSENTAPITRETTDMLLDAGGGHIRIWDISPELPGAVQTTGCLSAKGIVVSMAHTYATIEQARAAVDAGLRLVTHLFDTFEAPVSDDSGVYPCGLVDYLLVEDRVNCEIIGDGTHVPSLLVEKAFRCKTGDRLVFVTDSNVGAGLPAGKVTLPGGWGDAYVDGPNNGVRMIDRNMDLSGSALTPIDAFRNAIRLFGKSMAAASKICSRTPAALMGLNKGDLSPGKDADIIILSPELDLLCTISDGRMIYRK